MKKILLSITLLYSSLLYSQAPSNDCAENATIINQCGTSFTVSLATMKLATTDQLCQAGGSCPQYFINATTYQNLDCDATVYSGQSLGGDADIAIDNSMFWQFTSTVSCNYVISITATNCCCKDSGPSNGAQIQIYDISSTLPTGTILNYFGGNTGFINTYTQTISVTANQPVLILVDGINGSDCDISLSVSPGSGCACNIVLPIELVDFKGYYLNNYNLIKWTTASEINNDYFLIQRSKDCINWENISKIDGHGSTSIYNNYSYKDYSFIQGINYYRLEQVDYNGDKKFYNIIAINNDSNKKIIKILNILGNEVDIDYKGIKIVYYSNGEIVKVF